MISSENTNLNLDPYSPNSLLSIAIAFHIKSTFDWSFASAMGLMLLSGVLVIYWLYNKIVGIDNIKLG